MAEDVVTVRERDSMEQEKVPVGELVAYLDAAVRDWSRPASSLSD